MEVQQGCEQVQDLGNGAEEWQGWLDLFKERWSNVAQKYGNLGQSEQTENARQEYRLEDEADEIDGVQVDGEVLQALCKLFFEFDK